MRSAVVIAILGLLGGAPAVSVAEAGQCSVSQFVVPYPTLVRIWIRYPDGDQVEAVLPHSELAVSSFEGFELLPETVRVFPCGDNPQDSLREAVEEENKR